MPKIRLPLVLKSVSEKVKSHVRAGKRVSGYTRTGKPTKAVKKRPMALRASYDQMLKLNETIESNMGYLVYMGKEIAQVHGLDVQFTEGQPTGDLADLVSEGKHGMLIGGMEALKDKKTGDVRLMQMKTRAKQRMREIAKKFKGDVKLPRDVIKHLAIISSATEKFMKVNEGEKPSAEVLAEMVILHRRTREGGKVELDQEEKIARIEALEGYKGAQFIEDISISPQVEEADVAFWTKWGREERHLREDTHRIINKLVEEGSLTEQEREVLYLRFYVDHPEWRKGMGVRSFETIAKTFDERRGLKKLKVRKKVGDSHKFWPFRKVVTTKNVRVKGKPRGGKPYYYMKKKQVVTRVRHKTAMYAPIIEINPKSFVVQKPGKKQYTIQGRPPFKDLTTNPMQVFKIYQSGVEKILSHPTAPDRLKAALAQLQKSIVIVIRID